MAEIIDKDDTETVEKNTKIAITAADMSRKDKRKLLKKLKRKQIRQELAVKEREISEAVENDAAELEKLRRLEAEEAERMARDRLVFEAREREFLKRLEVKKQEEEEERRKREEDELKRELDNKCDEHEPSEGDDWEYVEEGPAEIIWKGNEIIVKKKKVKVPKKVPDLLKDKQESERPISNPLAPQSEVFEDYKSAQEVLKSVSQQVPNFGTEQDKAHCPFHLKTGVCRFGARCSRVHFYPDKSCTLLIKNMYSGPGLAFEQDEGLESIVSRESLCTEDGQLRLQITTLLTGFLIYIYVFVCTDEEVERSFEEFYEDVHTEFLKFGEIENFKVCKNASSHLRGNVYVHYRLLESAVLAYQSINARYFAGKQLSCEFVNLTRWKVAICGEYMKSRFKTCSRGSACNFIHCFRNPGGDYEWADWEKPAPRYWLQEMAALFGYSDGRSADKSSRYRLKRSRSRDPDSPQRKSPSSNTDHHRSRYPKGDRGECERKQTTPEYKSIKRRTESVAELYCSSDDQKPSRRNRDREHQVTVVDEFGKRKGGDRSLERKSRTSSKRKSDSESVHDHRHSSEKFSRFDEMSPHVDKHHSKHRGHESEIALQKKKEPYSSEVGSGDGLLRETLKDEADLSDSSNGSRFERHGRSQNKRINISSKYESENRESKRKRHQRNQRKSKGSDYPSEFTDSESERYQYRTDGRSRKSIKHRRQVKHEVESSSDASDEGKSLRHEKNPQKNGRTRSRSKNNCDLDVESNGKRLNREESELTEPINKTNDKSTTSQMVVTECELEQTYRMAALKKLEEKKKLKHALPAQSRKLNVSAEILCDDNTVVENSVEGSTDLEEISGSRKVGTGIGSGRRKRI